MTEPAQFPPAAGIAAPSDGPTPEPTRLSLRQRLDAYERLVRLDKPIGILLLLWPTLSALWIAAHGRPTWQLVLVFTLGTVVMRSAGCAFNDWADRKFDAFVKRTANRPLARGDIAPWEALLVASGFALAGFALTLLATNVTTVLLSVVALAIAIAYPFFKRFFALPQAFLGVAFSFGIPMAFTAVQETVPALGWQLFAANLLWVIAYDTEYAMVDRDDDIRLGIRTSALTFGRFDIAAVGACYAAYLAGMAWIGAGLGFGANYVAGLAIAVVLAGWHLWLIRARARDACFRAFLGNHWLGFAVFAGVVADYAVRAQAWPRARGDGREGARGSAARAPPPRSAARAGRGHPRADPRQLSGRGIARGPAVLRAPAQPLLAAARRRRRRAAARDAVRAAPRLPPCARDRRLGRHRRLRAGGQPRRCNPRRDARGETARVHRAAPAVELVCFNGRTAARAAPAWREAGYATLELPSTSPAYTRPFAEKLAAWRVIADHLPVRHRDRHAA